MFSATRPLGCVLVGTMSDRRLRGTGVRNGTLLNGTLLYCLIGAAEAVSFVCLSCVCSDISDIVVLVYYQHESPIHHSLLWKTSRCCVDVNRLLSVGRGQEWSAPTIGGVKIVR